MKPVKTINVTAAKAQFSRLVKQAVHGNEVVITKAGKPIAKLVPCEAPSKRKPGALKGKIWISPDFDKPDPELEALFYDGPIEPQHG